MNKLIVASAGSGKTTFIIEDAYSKSQENKRVLITTFTETCRDEIKECFYREYGAIPVNIRVQTWWSFLITHGVKPFQGALFDFDVKGLLLVNGKSGFRARNRVGQPIYWGEDNFDKYYFSSTKKVYSDKLAKLVVRCNTASDGAVFERISKYFPNIYIDEVQDLAGFDLVILDELFNTCANVTLVGDPRQASYSTHSTSKLGKYKKSEIVNFFLDDRMDIEVDGSSLTINHRCNDEICRVSNELYADFVPSESGQTEVTGHDGVFILSDNQVDRYLDEFSPLQLRNDVRRKVSKEYETLNFGKSKGLTRDRVLIYATKPMVDWLINRDAEITRAARCKLYIAMTRAKYSVAIVVPNAALKKIDTINHIIFEEKNESVVVTCISDSQ